ncbi:elongation factor 1-gamma [Exaiptasia diaphana]|uniref:Elongation factor 1-gamma n=1 Tax=Exaiptasia diaphana TaxID=2652724 RepID=A0A913WZY6_EXADI|nr:elongation factor 1-gamma [Exaiptasia diaphana]
MAAGTLYTYPDSFRAQKILIAAEYSGTKINVPPFTVGKDNKTEEFLKKFPLGKVPAFETSDGKYLYESNAIAYYVSNEQLHGTNKFDAAMIQQYVNFADQEILPAAATWVFPTLGLTQYQKQATDKAMEDIKKCMAALNNALLTKTFLVGERVTLADIAVCCNLVLLYKQVMEPSFRDAYGNVNRWFMTCINQPHFKKILGEVKLCEHMAKFDSKKYFSLHPKKDDKKKETKPKEQKPKPAKKEEPKDETPKEEEKPKPKAGDPFAELPPTDFSMDAWKKVYMNEETDVSIPYFWKNYDPEGYSIWFAEYMYNKDLGLTFMTHNLIRGMFQRIEKLQKTCFANVMVFGKNNDSAIAGVWVTRGHKLVFDLNDSWNIDAPSYKWTKLDINNEEDKKKINDYLLWDENLSYDGKKLEDGEIFK